MHKVSCDGRIWVALATLALAATARGAGAEEDALVRGAGGELRVAARGLSLTPAVGACPASAATGEHWWAITLEPAPGDGRGGELVLESQNQAGPGVERIPDGVRLTYPSLSGGEGRHDIALALTIRARGAAFELGAEIANRTSGWVVNGFIGPVLNGIRTDLGATPALFPSGLGLRINGVPRDERDARPWAKRPGGYIFSAPYPSAKCTMQWIAFAGAEGGLYLGSHDAGFGAKSPGVRYDPGRQTFGAAFQHHVFVRPGETVALPPTVAMPYAGDWHAAARAYRAWADSASRPIDRPDWAKTASGWLLAILKQQNGDVMWPYDTLERLAQVADERGLDILGLFGWAYGGHDHLYPDYDPCPIMGGEPALREGIRRAKARGKRVILYANGQLQERGTAYWTATGRHLAVTRGDGGTVQEFWHKYGNTPGYHFDIGCHATAGWRERMLSLAMRANDLGADGILYDQLGMRAPTACYAAGHGHPVPHMSYEADRREMLRAIAVEMRGINPEFVVMTEGFHDAILDSIAYFHGCVRGVFQESAGLIAGRQGGAAREELFPELVRFTYPEVASTIRFPSPLVDRPMANYTVAFGLRFEIESRYLPDRDYLVEGRIPAIEDYGTVLSKPDIGLVRSLPPKETAAYLRAVSAFQKENADLLMTGAFADTEGFSIEGGGVVAKGFRSGDRLGIVLWNVTDRPARFTLRVPGAECVCASEPVTGRVDPAGDLAPQTLRLIVWKIPRSGR